MSQSLNTSRIDRINILLLIGSCFFAFIIPFELFLFAYAILGPLHYLTEISWLHDKNYYATDKRDVILLLVISLFLAIIYLFFKLNVDALAAYVDLQNLAKVQGHLIFIAFGSSLFFAFIKKPLIKWIGVGCLLVLTIVSNYLLAFFTIFLPTLVHVFLFTSIFMLYGSLKSKSKMGFLSVALHLICPFLLFYLFPSKSASSSQAIDTFMNSDFAGLNQYLYKTFFFTNDGSLTQDGFIGMVRNSKYGIAIMRFISFAYLYHYLNWFSKTEVIRWHQVPKQRFMIVIGAWVVSVVLYLIDYKLGFQWLYLLSFMHVLLEFPLNFKSFAGIFQELGLKPKMAAS